MTLAAEEFIRRFLLHVLPPDFHRIRHFGFLAGCHRTEKLTLCRRLLSMPPAAAAAPSEPDTDYRDRFEQLTGSSWRSCPLCGQGLMVITERFEPGQEPPPPQDDTS